MEFTDKQKIDDLFKKLSLIISEKKDSEIPKLLGNGILNEFLHALAPPKTDKDQKIYDYLYENKNRLQLVALIRHAISQNYSIKGTTNGLTAYVSPDFHQWYDDGVMFLQGKERFEGLIGLYQDGVVKFAVSGRDVQRGEEIGPDDLLFLDIDEYQLLSSKVSLPKNSNEIDTIISNLELMLEQHESRESAYQTYFEHNPWVLGLQYTKIQSHMPLDDEKIPDFSGVRATDGSRDIIEIKQPFLELFRKDGSFRMTFYVLGNRPRIIWNSQLLKSTILRIVKDYFSITLVACYYLDVIYQVSS